MSSASASFAVNRSRPSRGSRVAVASCAASQSRCSPSADRACAHALSTGRPTSAASAGTTVSIRSAVPASWRRAVSVWMRVAVPSRFRAAVKYAGMACSRATTDSTRSAAGANGREVSACSAAPGLCSIGSHVGSAISARSSSSARSVVRSTSASTCSSADPGLAVPSRARADHESSRHRGRPLRRTGRRAGRRSGARRGRSLRRGGGATTRPTSLSQGRRTRSCPRRYPLGVGGLLQFVAQQLAGRIARQGVDELDVAGDLVARQLGLDVPLDLVDSTDSCRRLRTTNALSRLPKSSSATPITAASATASCSSSRFSTSAGKTFSPPDTIMSSSRPSMNSRPSSSKCPTSPEDNSPSISSLLTRRRCSRRTSARCRRTPVP